MQRNELGDLAAFLAVADTLSFTGAAARIGTSQSALSHAIRRLEARVDMRLFTRTTRRIALTAAGQQLLRTLGPAFDGIHASLASLDALRASPGGTLRITSSRHAADTLLMPAVRRLLAAHPALHIEVSVDQRLTDIVGDGFDAGVRLGERVEKDMVAMRISPDLRMAVVAAPAYFERHPVPRTPHELTAHRCINLRMPTRGNLYAWEFEKDGHPLNVRVDGPLTSNDVPTVLDAALHGVGLACFTDDVVSSALASGQLVRVLEDWCPPFPGYHLYYPNRRQHTPAFSLLLDALRMPDPPPAAAG